MLRLTQLIRDEKGQIFVGYIIGIMLMLLIMVNVTNMISRMRKSDTKRIYQERALDVARQGFEEGLSFFRNQSDGVGLKSCCEGNAPSSQAYVSPWPLHPDSAFMPQSTHTDHWNQISMAAQSVWTSMPAAGPTAQGIVRTFPLGTFSSMTNSTVAEIKTSTLFGRYVIRRQNRRNWSPAANTMAAFSDPEATHDITHLRSNAVPGSGNYWSMVSTGYVILGPRGVTLSSGLTNTAMHEGSSLLSPPKVTYLNRPLLLAKARVYGELYRINFNDQGAAIWVSRGAAVTCNTNCIIGADTGAGVARPDGTNVNVVGTGSFVNTYSTALVIPSVTAAFPGMTTTELKKKANVVGGINIFPKDTDSDYSVRTSTNTFYYVTTSASDSPAYTAHFLPGTAQRVMAGNGLVFIDGNLQIDLGNLSNWNGVVFVNGNVSLRGPTEIAGTLIATGTVTMGNASDVTKAILVYNANLVASAKKFLQRFSVIQNSISATLD